MPCWSSSVLEQVVCVLRPRCTLVLVSFQVICCWSASDEDLLKTLKYNRFPFKVSLLLQSLDGNPTLNMFLAV